MQTEALAEESGSLVRDNSLEGKQSDNIYVVDIIEISLSIPPLAIYIYLQYIYIYTQIIHKSHFILRISRERVETLLAITCQAHAQLFVAEKAACSAGGTVTGVHDFILKVIGFALPKFWLLSPPLSLHRHFENLGGQQPLFFITFSSFLLCLMKLLQVKGGSNGGEIVSSMQLCGCVAATTLKEGNM